MVAQATTVVQGAEQTGSLPPVNLDLESQQAPSKLQGRTVEVIRTNASHSEGKAAGGGCGVSLPALLLIAGGIMYGVCKDEEGSCEKIAEAGEIMMIVGGSLYGLFCCCLGIKCVVDKS